MSLQTISTLQKSLDAARESLKNAIRENADPEVIEVLEKVVERYEKLISRARSI